MYIYICVCVCVCVCMQEPKDASFNRDLETQSGRHKTFYTGYLNCHSLQFVCLFFIKSVQKPNVTCFWNREASDVFAQS